MAERITINDIRKAGFCASGARGTIEHYGVDFRDFMKNGMDQDEFLAIGEGFARIVVERKLERG